MEITKTESWIMMNNDEKTVKNCKGIYNFEFIMKQKLKINDSTLKLIELTLRT